MTLSPCPLKADFFYWRPLSNLPDTLQRCSSQCKNRKQLHESKEQEHLWAKMFVELCFKGWRYMHIWNIYIYLSIRSHFHFRQEYALLF